MEATFQLLDCDYIVINNTPIIRLFGKTEDNKTVCTFYEQYKPYFYVLPKEGSENELIKFIEEKFKDNVIGISKEEKLLPIGIQEKAKELIKITLNDPSQTPMIRDELLAKPFIEDVFEADILFKNRFMADFGICGMRWYKTEGMATKTQTVKTNTAIKAEKINEITKSENAGLRYLSIDIEITTQTEELPDPTKHPISLIGLSFYPKFKDMDSLVLISKPVPRTKGVAVLKNEKTMLEELLGVIDSFDPDVITGYNINNFDLPYILTRLTENNLNRFLGRDNQKQSMSKKIGARTRTNVTGRIVADVYELIKESIGKGILRLKRYGLGDVSKELLGKDKIGISHGEISKHWNGSEEQMLKLIEYTRVDAQLAIELLLNKSMLDKFIELAKVSGTLLQDALDGGEATRVENILLREFNKRNYVIPLKPTSGEMLRRKLERETKGLKGALVLEPEVGLHTTYTVYLDFKSMYPSIFISYNICPTTLVIGKTILPTIKAPNGAEFISSTVREGIIPYIVKELIRERDKVRKEMKKEPNESQKRLLDAKQLALKYVTNSFYGYTGYIRARLYLLDIANAITSCGRHLIQKTKAIIETDKSLKTIYGDTDSVMVKTQLTNIDDAWKLGGEIESKVNENLKGIIEIKIENVFKSLLILSKKRYAGLAVETENGGVKEQMIMKGIETVRRDWCDLTSETLFKALDLILKEQQPKRAAEYVREVIQKLAKGEIPVEKLGITKTISKLPKDYKGIQPHIELVKKLRKRDPTDAPGIGDRVEFVIVHGSQLMSNRAEDPGYVKKHNLKIDSRYYIESQILPPLERVFEAVKVTKSELVGMGKQLVLLDIMKNIAKKPHVSELNSIDGFICDKCEQTYNRPPLMGKCTNCNSEIMFYSGNKKSRIFS